MSREAEFIAAVRAISPHPAARGLIDDAAVIDPSGAIVVTHDMLAEGVHYLSDDPPDSVAWKLVAANLSDLGAKGAEPVGVLLGYALTGDADWDTAFVTGLHAALAAFDVPLLGGDTIKLPDPARRVLSLTAIGRAPPGGAPSRACARPRDILCVTGTIGDAALGLAIRLGRETGDHSLVEAYRRPRPPVAFGRAAADRVTAMMDVSDGPLVDAARLCDASGCALEIALDAVPLSSAYVATRGESADARMAAATGGDDYQLLFTAAPDAVAALRDAAERLGTAVAAIGACTEGSGLTLSSAGAPVALPERLGWLHD